ncbi:DUF6326 family protein [Ulvibacter antarcticus]|uniref:DoxX-like protein n=1 Tax=Ulvibacter antarcticus TaxID=442714 RepID=A0A3L9Z1T0_9FLAO|nr:DUF6326 family protein [Ulvibacter antarcticus]RMA65967.1 hypothetical protein BXY75_0383 [Ulvibacter antarcticus]
MLENPRINIRIKLAVLWTSLMFCYIYGDYFELYAPDKVESLLNGMNILDSPTKLFFASFILAIPALMISLSVFLKPKICKWLTIIFGVFFTLVVTVVASTALYAWYTFYVFYAVLEALITISIVWLAWNWPKEKL